MIDPACSLVFEDEDDETDLMQRPPRTRRERLVDRATLWRSLVQGSAASCAVIAIYAMALRHCEVEVARTLGFTTLLVANLALIVLNRSQRRGWWANLLAPNRALRVVLAGAAGLYAATLVLPGLRELFVFAPPAPAALLAAVAAGLLAVVPLGLVPRDRREGSD